MIVRELVTLLGFKMDDAPQRRYDKQLDATKERTNALATATKGIGLAWKIAAAAVGVGFGWISKNILSAAGQMETYRMQLETFAGSADAAALTLENLRNSAAGQLFSTGSLVSAHNQLRLLGMSAESTGAMVGALGDIANGSEANFNALSNALVRASAEGKVNERTLRQLAQAGFGVQDMAHGLGMSEQHLMSMVAAGRIGFDDLTRAMQNSTKEGGRFYQNAARQAQTLNGSIRILRNTLFDIGEAIGSNVLPRIVDLINRLTNLLRLGSDGLVSFGTRAFDRLLTALARVYLFFRILEIRMRQFGGAFAPFKALFGGFSSFISGVIESAEPMLLNLATLILVAFRPIKAFALPILEALGAVIRRVFGFIATIIGWLIPIVYGLTPVFGAAGRAVGGLIGPLFAVAVAVRGVKAAFAIARVAITTFKKAQMAAKAVTMIFSGNLVKMRAGLMGLTGSAKLAKIATLAFGAAQAKAKALASAFSLALVKQKAALVAGKIALAAKTAAMGVAKVAKVLATVKQWALNIAMMANPVGLIVIAVMALIAAIVALVRNWDRVTDAIRGAFAVIGNFFVRLWDGIRSLFSRIVGFVRDNAANILNIILTILFFPAGVIMAIVRLVIGHWDTIREALGRAGEFIKGAFGRVREAVAGAFGKVREAASSAWDNMREGVSRFGAAAGNAFGRMREAASSAFGRVREAASGAFARMREGAGNAAANVNGGIRELVGGVKRFFTGLWGAVREGPSATLEFIRNAVIALVENIRAAFLRLMDAIGLGELGETIVRVISSAVARVKRIWESLVGFMRRLLDRIADAWRRAWNGLVSMVRNVVEGIKNIWIGIIRFFGQLFDMVLVIGRGIWDGIRNIISAVVGRIQDVWSGIVGFFADLWEAVRQSPMAAIEFIQNAFFGLFDRIVQRFTGFIDAIREGFGRVTGFFGGLVDGAVSFFTGGGDYPSPQPVNDLILTPQGSYSTHPDDYIMAMKDPSSLLDSLARYLGSGMSPQPAYAGLSGAAMSSAAGRNIYNNSSSSSVSNTNVKAPITVNVDASGMSPEQAASIVRRGVQDAISGAVNGCRGSIPSPEARRN